jgi:hypothetical protein
MVGGLAFWTRHYNGTTRRTTTGKATRHIQFGIFNSASCSSGGKDSLNLKLFLHVAAFTSCRVHGCLVRMAERLDTKETVILSFLRNRERHINDVSPLVMVYREGGLSRFLILQLFPFFRRPLLS